MRGVSTFAIRAFIEGPTDWATAEGLAGFNRALLGREARRSRVLEVTAAPAVSEDRVSFEFVVDAPSGHDGWIGAERIVREALAPQGFPEFLTNGADSAHHHIGLAWFPGQALPTSGGANVSA
jgi:hypothetical protein